MTAANADGDVIGSVCHGALGLVNAKDTDGTPLIEGRTVTGVTDTQIDQLGISMTPKHPETELRAAKGEIRMAGHRLSRHVRDPCRRWTATLSPARTRTAAPRRRIGCWRYWPSNTTHRGGQMGTLTAILSFTRQNRIADFEWDENTGKLPPQLRIGIPALAIALGRHWLSPRAGRGHGSARWRSMPCS